MTFDPYCPTTRIFVGAGGVVVLNTTSGDGNDLIPIELIAVTSKTMREVSTTDNDTEFVPVTSTILVLVTLDNPYRTECATTAGSEDGSHVTTICAAIAVEVARRNAIRVFIRGGIGLRFGGAA